MTRTFKRVAVVVSDLTAKEVSDDKAVRITIAYADKERGRVVIDAAEDEVADLIAKGTVVEPRTRGKKRRNRKTAGAPTDELAGDEGVELL